MGQAFRRASRRIQTPDASSSCKPNPAVARPPPPNAAAGKAAEISRAGEQASLDADGRPRVNFDNILEERDPKYDAMLGQMVGRIKSNPGGKAEMGEAKGALDERNVVALLVKSPRDAAKMPGEAATGASLVEKYDRPMPKLRNTKPDSGGYVGRPAPAGTLNIAQLRHIVLLYEGKADDHNGPMEVHQIAEKFQVDVAQVQKILQFLSQPPEGSSKDKNKTTR